MNTSNPGKGDEADRKQRAGADPGKAIPKHPADTTASGDAYTLIEGTGHYYGQFVINGLDTTRSYFFQDGAARACDFTLKLTRVDDGLLSKVTSVATGLLQ